MSTQQNNDIIFGGNMHLKRPKIWKKLLPDTQDFSAAPRSTDQREPHQRKSAV